MNDSKPNKCGDVEITPEMIEAGVIALEGCRGAFDDWNLVVAAYTAMERSKLARKVCEGRSACAEERGN